MTIHAVDKNMAVENVIIDYRDRPDGSESKLNTYSDGFKVLKTIIRLYKNYKPRQFLHCFFLLAWYNSADIFCTGVYNLYKDWAGSANANPGHVRILLC